MAMTVENRASGNDRQLTECESGLLGLNGTLQHFRKSKWEVQGVNGALQQVTEVESELLGMNSTLPQFTVLNGTQIGASRTEWYAAAIYGT